MFISFIWNNIVYLQEIMQSIVCEEAGFAWYDFGLFHFRDPWLFGGIWINSYMKQTYVDIFIHKTYIL